MICPCKDCEKKGCGAYHDKCKKYQEYELERQGIRHQKMLYQEFEYVKKIRRKRNGKK